MTASQLEGAIESAVKILADWDQFLGDLSAFSGPDDSTKFNLSGAIPSLTPPVTVEELSQKLSGTVALVQEFSKIESTILIPDTIITGLIASVASVRAAAEKLISQTTSMEYESKITALNGEAFSATNEKGQQLNVAPGLAELYPLVQNLLTVSYQVRSMAGLSGKGGLALELAQIQVARSAQRQSLADFKRLTRAAASQKLALESQAASAAAAAERIVSLEAQANTDITRVSESQHKADELIATATASEQAANRLKETVEAYSKSFATFQKDLDARNTAFEKGKADLDTFLKESGEKRDTLLTDQTNKHNSLVEAISSDKGEIDRLLTRSRAVLGEATVSGLSESFGKEMKDATDQLWWIQLLFFISVGLLLMGAGVVLDAFPWLSAVIHITKPEAPASGAPLSVAVYLLANFLRTLTFLLAPLLLLIFAARRYTELFRMKAHYTYKFTVAASLPGFKLEAPTYAEAITASAFEELLFNPGDAAGRPEDDSADKSGNTFVQRLIEPIVRRAMDKMGEIPKS